MNRSIRVTAAVLGSALLFGGCATKAQLRRGLAEQSAAQSAALQAERAERIAGEQRLAGDLASLRTDLAGLKTDFGAKLAALEAGLQVAVPVHFEFGKAAIRPEMQATLDRFLQVVQRHYPGSTITVEGFTDPAGSAAFNKRLSQQRAEAVRGYLAERGLPETQMRAVGYGEERLVVPGAASSEYGADLNRRVVFVVETPNAAQAVALTQAPTE
jgi:peptidoglycan-associated lipoprotein